MVDYSKWSNIEVSDDEDDTHPNIDTASLFRWRHQARIEREEEARREKKELEEKKKEVIKKKEEIVVKESAVEDESVKKKLEELEIEEKKLKQKEEEIKVKERLAPKNVDNLSKDGWSKTIFNKEEKRKVSDMSEEEKENTYREFVSKYKKDIEHYGMLSKWEDCKQFLIEHPVLVCEDTANYLAIWCLNLAIEDKLSLMEHISKQVIAMQYILELSKQLDLDPRSCVRPFFTRIEKVDKQYQDAFEDELESFKRKIKERARVKIEEAVKEVEEEERQKRLGPGGLDPVEVFESLPPQLQKCFESKDIALLQQTISELPEEEAKMHLKRCVDSGLWIPDGRHAGSQTEDKAEACGGEEEVYDEVEKVEK